MFVGGIFVGFGTRMADGCTSGHGIFGLSNFEWPSLMATVSFMSGGIVTTQLIYHVVMRYAEAVDAALYLVLSGTLFGFVLRRQALQTTTTSRACSCSAFPVVRNHRQRRRPDGARLWAIKRYGRTPPDVRSRSNSSRCTAGISSAACCSVINWSITGMCPVPIFVNIGEGKLYAIAALAGAGAGAAVFSMIYDTLRKFGLPALKRPAKVIA